jgi:hypothetical protein
VPTKKCLLRFIILFLPMLPTTAKKPPQEVANRPSTKDIVLEQSTRASNPELFQFELLNTSAHPIKLTLIYQNKEIVTNKVLNSFTGFLRIGNIPTTGLFTCIIRYGTKEKRFDIATHDNLMILEFTTQETLHIQKSNLVSDMPLARNVAQKNVIAQ